jgi:hypothetical protein
LTHHKKVIKLKQVITIFLIFLGQFAIGQIDKLSKREIKDFLKKDIYLYASNWEKYGKDSVLFKADTIILYNYADSLFEIKGNRYIMLVFNKRVCALIKREKFIKLVFINRAFALIEVSKAGNYDLREFNGTGITSTITGIRIDKDFFTIRIDKDKDPVILKRYSRKKLIDEFKIIEISLTNNTYRKNKLKKMVLLRIK